MLEGGGTCSDRRLVKISGSEEQKGDGPAYCSRDAYLEAGATRSYGVSVKTPGSMVSIGKPCILHIHCKGLGECQTVRMTHQTVGWVRVAIRCALLIEDVSNNKGS
jgi:hypothetical protein